MSRPSQRIGIVLSVCSAMAFGTLAVSGKFAYADGISVSALMWLRFGLASIGFWLIVWWKHLPLPSLKNSLIFLALGAFVLAPEVTFFFMGLEAPGMSAGLAETIFFVFPVWAVVLHAIERRSWPQLTVLAGSLAALFGVALTARDISAAAATGIPPLLLASLMYATYVVLSGRYVQIGNGFVAATLMTTGAALALGLRAATSPSVYPQSIQGWIAVVSAVAIGTFAAYAFLYAALERISSAIAAVVATLEPVVAIVVGFLMLGETLTALQALGAIIVIVSIAFVVARENRVSSPTS